MIINMNPGTYSNPSVPPRFTGEVEISSELYGSKVLYATDEFFSGREALLLPSDPNFVPDQFDPERGELVDGWETRRRRSPGCEYCIIELPKAARVSRIEVDTRTFTGNSPAAVTIDVCHLTDKSSPGAGDWERIATQEILADSINIFTPRPTATDITHVRFSIYPDGGVARFRLFGRFSIEAATPGSEFEASSALFGAEVVAWNDSHWGSPGYLTAPRPPKDMGEGWETRRRRVPGFDWAIIKLARPVLLSRVIIDTTYFIGNPPIECSLNGALSDLDTGKALVADSTYWGVVMPPDRVEANKENIFNLNAKAPVNYVRFNVIPDGGVARLRLFGRLYEESRA